MTQIQQENSFSPNNDKLSKVVTEKKFEVFYIRNKHMTRWFARVFNLMISIQYSGT